MKILFELLLLTFVAGCTTTTISSSTTSTLPPITTTTSLTAPLTTSQETNEYSFFSVVEDTVVKAYFIPNADEELYGRVNCDVADDWKLLNKNNMEWSETPLWYRD